MASPVELRDLRVQISPTQSNFSERSLRSRKSPLKSANSPEQQTLLGRSENKQPSKVYKYRYAVIALVLLFCIYLASLSNSPKQCDTPECVMISARILGSIDKSVDPCKNFYQFSCGNWLNENPIPSDESSISIFSQIYQRNANSMRNILSVEHVKDESLSESDSELDKLVFTKVKTVYDTCMDEKTIDAKGFKPLVKLLEQVNSQLQGEMSPKWMAKAIATIHSLQTMALFKFEVEVDEDNPDINRLSFQQGGLGMPSREYYHDPVVRSFYYNTSFQVISAVFPLINATFANDTVENIVLFEEELANVSKPKWQMVDPLTTYNLFSVEQIQQMSPKVDWLEYLNLIYQDSPFKPTTSTLVDLNNPDYIKGISTVLPNFTQETIKNYFLLFLINRMLPKLGKEQRDLLSDQSKYGKPAIEIPRFKKCLMYVDSAMGDVAGKWFVQREFPGQSKNNALELATLIKESFKSRLAKLEWIDESTRKKAVYKLEKLGLLIGYPDFIFNATAAFSKYSDLLIGDDFFENMLNASKFTFRLNLREIDQVADTEKWKMTPISVNAYYSPSLNRLVFPAAILKPPFYSQYSPAYLNYGGIGTIIGHEVTHAFDNIGNKFDYRGRLTNWWSKSTFQHFEEKTKCFADQFSQYSIQSNGKKLFVNGNLTLAENLADAGGIERALNAWKEAHSRNSAADFALPGLSDYSFDQLFFIAFGQLWCSDMETDYQLKLLRTDPHAPNQFRVNGALSNSIHFAKAFNCPSSPMNPTNKCTLW